MRQDETNVPEQRRWPMIFLMTAIVFGIVIAIMNWSTLMGFIHFPVAAPG